MTWPYMCTCETHNCQRREKYNNYSFNKQNTTKGFQKQSKALQAATIKSTYPDKLPLIIERCKKERQLPKVVIKYLVPFDMTIGTLSYIIRKRLQLTAKQTILLLVNNHQLYSASYPICDVFRDEKGEDGFLHIYYSSEQVYG